MSTINYSEKIPNNVNLSEEGISLNLRMPYQVTHRINEASSAGRYRPQPITPELVGLAYSMPWIALSAGAAVGYAGIGVTAGGAGFSALPGSVAIPLGAAARQAPKLIPRLAP